MASRRFRNLELGDGPLDPEEAAPHDADVCRRCGAEASSGESQCKRCGGVLGGPGQEAFDVAFHARQAAVQTGAIRPHSDGPASHGQLRSDAAREEPGYGSVLAAAALTACIFALVSIPIRLAFSAAFDAHAPGRAVPELLLVAALTLALRRIFAGALRAL